MTESDLLKRADQLLSRITGLSPPRAVRCTIQELRQPTWGDWVREPGVYYFVHQGEVVYIGRALCSQALGNEIGTYINQYDNPEWAAVIRDESTVVGLLVFPRDDWHWVATLEVWLIDGPSRPKFNKRF